MSGRLDGRVAVVTGGASGIGLEIAKRYVEEGARALLSDMSAENLAKAKAELGDAVATCTADVRSEGEVEQAVAAAVEQFGRVDIGVNSAGLGTYAPIVDQTSEQWSQILDVCLTGVFYSIKHEARQMQRQGDGGVIINIASLNAFQPAEGMSAYCTSKAGVEMLTRVAAMELGRDAIRVCGIAPGLVDTPLTAGLSAIPAIRAGYLENIPLGRAGTTADIANAALFLASDEASWVSGETMSVDGAARTKRYPEFMKIFGEMAETE